MLTQTNSPIHNTSRKNSLSHHRLQYLSLCVSKSEKSHFKNFTHHHTSKIKLKINSNVVAIHHVYNTNFKICSETHPQQCLNLHTITPQSHISKSIHDYISVEKFTMLETNFLRHPYAQLLHPITLQNFPTQAHIKCTTTDQLLTKLHHIMNISMISYIFNPWTEFSRVCFIAPWFIILSTQQSTMSHYHYLMHYLLQDKNKVTGVLPALYVPLKHTSRHHTMSFTLTLSQRAGK